MVNKSLLFGREILQIGTAQKHSFRTQYSIFMKLIMKLGYILYYEKGNLVKTHRKKIKSKHLDT